MSVSTRFFAFMIAKKHWSALDSTLVRILHTTIKKALVFSVPVVREEMSARFQGLACDAASTRSFARMKFMFSEQRLSVDYFDRAVVDGYHESNYRVFLAVPPHCPLSIRNCEVMEVRFWRQP